MERDPKVPVPIAIWSVSPYLKRTRSGREPEPVGDDLPERGRMALAVIVGAHRERQRAGRIEAQLGVLDQPEIGRLDRVGNADAAQLAAPRRFLAPRRKSAHSRPS